MFKIIALLIISLSLFSSDIFFISKKWQEKVEKYKKVLVENKCKLAIKESTELLEIDPSSTEAMFYLFYASKKCIINPPTWLGKPFSWPNATVKDKFYIDLAKNIK